MSVHQEADMSLDSRSMRRSRIASKHRTHRYDQSSMGSEDNQFIKAYNQGSRTRRGNNSFAFPSQTPRKSQYNTINVSKLSQQEQSLSPKKKTLIEQLTEKNEMLQREVDRVEHILNMGDNRKNKRLPELDGNVMKKQLENAYKQIKMYEIDIAHREKYYQHEGSYVEKIRKTQKTLAQRQDMVRKLNAEISQNKKQSNQYVKLLQDGHIKKEYVNKTSRLHKQIKFYETQLKEEEELSQIDHYTKQEKHKKIQQMEQQLVSSGFDKAELFRMYRKYEERGANKTSQSRMSNDMSQGRSKKSYEGVKGQISMLKKMQKDYAKKMENLQKEREQAEVSASQAKEKLEYAKRQLEKLEQRFLQMKKNIDPVKLKPLYANGTLNESSITQFGKGKGNPLQHNFQTVEVGQYSKKSTAVNDRSVLGKKSAYIVQLTLFENRSQYLGFQAVYLIGDMKKKGTYNVLRRPNERFLKDKKVQLQPGDYFRHFQCAINSENVITGFSAMSFNGKTLKVGLFQGFKKQIDLKPKEYPCCLYGSYTNEGFQMMGVEKVEPQS